LSTNGLGTPRDGTRATLVRSFEVGNQNQGKHPTARPAFIRKQLPRLSVLDPLATRGTILPVQMRLMRMYPRMDKFYDETFV
jgi:hypothetical protein